MRGSAQERTRLAAPAPSPAVRQCAALHRWGVREGGRCVRRGGGRAGAPASTRACAVSPRTGNRELSLSVRDPARNEPGGARASPPRRSPAASLLDESCGPAWAGLLFSNRSRVGVGPARPDLQRCGVWRGCGRSAAAWNQMEDWAQMEGAGGLVKSMETILPKLTKQQRDTISLKTIEFRC